LANICSAEDLKVILAHSEDGHYGMLALDGHKGNTENVHDPTSGKGCRDIIHKHRDMLKQLLLEQGAAASIDKCQELCLNENSGAMAIACDYFKGKLRVASLGDCFLWVFVKKDSKFELFYEHETHDEKHYERYIDQAQNLGIYPQYRLAQPYPLPNGNWEVSSRKKPCYYEYPNGEFFAACSGLGHRGIPCIGKIVQTITIPPNKDFYVVIGSDGVSDVIHPQASFWQQCPDHAKNIFKEAYRRWGRTGETWEIKRKEDGHVWPSFSFAPISDKQADDISVGLLTGFYEKN
jgi:hypothetical protein